MNIEAKQKIKTYIHSHLAEMIDLRRATEEELQKEQLRGRIQKHIQSALAQIEIPYRLSRRTRTRNHR